MGQKSSRTNEEGSLNHRSDLHEQALRGPITAVAAPQAKREEEFVELDSIRRVVPLDPSSVDPTWRALFARSQVPAVVSLEASAFESIFATIQTYIMRSSATTVSVQESITQTIVATDAVAGLLSRRFALAARNMARSRNALRVVKNMSVDVSRARDMTIRCTDTLRRVVAMLPHEVVAQAQAAAAEAAAASRREREGAAPKADRNAAKAAVAAALADTAPAAPSAPQAQPSAPSEQSPQHRLAPSLTPVAAAAPPAAASAGPSSMPLVAASGPDAPTDAEPAPTADAPTRVDVDAVDESAVTTEGVSSATAAATDNGPVADAGPPVTAGGERDAPEGGTAGASASEPAPAPAVADAAVPTEAPTGPADAPADAPGDALADAPADAPGDAPSDVPADAPESAPDAPVEVAAPATPATEAVQGAEGA